MARLLVQRRLLQGWVGGRETYTGYHTLVGCWHPGLALNQAHVGSIPTECSNFYICGLLASQLGFEPGPRRFDPYRMFQFHSTVADK